MTPHYADDWLTVYGGDVREVLPELASDSVDCIVTSPPYWGLRDYGTATWIGGDEGCDHSAGSHAWATPTEQAKKRVDSTMPFRGVCGRCGASRSDSQLGLEATPEEYVANLVGVFREVRRVLKPSGTCWLNLGDSYAGSGKGGNPADSPFATFLGNGHREPGTTPPYLGLAQKQLVGIPWRVAFALQADGWYLRSDIIWAKPNPMPESVTDRPTKAHEYLFLLSKSPRYYFDQEAVREDAKYGRREWTGDVMGRVGFDAHQSHGTVGGADPSAGRNLRSVWTIATAPYPGAHFATFPPELPERCIKAGSSERGVCPECGAPWERVVDKSRTFESGSGKTGHLPIGKNGAHLQGGGETLDIRMGPVVHTTTVGWEPSCACERDGGGWAPVPATILDPFAGSGTVGLVANRLSRRAILIDLNPAYLEQQMQRNAQVPVGL